MLVLWGARAGDRQAGSPLDRCAQGELAASLVLADVARSNQVADAMEAAFRQALVAMERTTPDRL